MEHSIMLEMRNIHKGFHRGTVNEMILFSDFCFSVVKGSFVSVVGSNGSGKTTLLNLVSGSMPVDGGEIFLGNQKITGLPEHKRAERIGRVFQNPAMGTVPTMTITENLSIAENKGKRFGLSFAVPARKKQCFRETVAELGLGLEDKMELPVGLLSGGQRQALSLLMSAMTPIDLLLLDEHTAALDPRTAETVMLLTGRIVKEKKLTALMVTHNLRYAVEYGDRLVMMHNGSAVLDMDGEEKRNCKVEDLLSRFNQISVECGN